MIVLLTGGAGFIGSHLAERLASIGHDVHVLDALTDTYSPELKALNVQGLRDRRINFQKLDLAAADLHRAMHNVEFVFHLAGQPGISAALPFEVFAHNNILATSRLLDSVRGSRVLRGFINISTSSVYGIDASGDETTTPAPASSYGVSKLAAEQLVLARSRDEGMPACSLRLFSVYGPRERPEKLYTKLIGCLIDDREFPLFDGSAEHIRSYTYVGDIVDGMIAVMNQFDRCNGEIFNLGTEDAITTAQAIRIAESLVGRRARIVTQPKRPGEQLRTRANIGKARRVLGYSPRVSLEDGLAQEIAWYRAHISGKIDLW
jgi:UDP-glucuronate 4-epimerase